MGSMTSTTSNQMRTTLYALAAPLCLAAFTLSSPALGCTPSPTAPDKKKGDDASPMVEASKVAPPGTVPVKGGSTRVGSKPKDIEELLQTEAYQGYARTLDGETPQHDVKIDPFHMGKFEVTNEQYLAFVEDTGYRPPTHWGEAAIFAAQTEFGRQEAEKAKAARDAGERYVRKKWDNGMKKRWWDENWADAEWSIPEGLESAPVVFVDFSDASAYCEWAGVRIPSEEEWIHSARGNKEQWFPWGNEWEAEGRAHTQESRRKKLFNVGSFPGGASPYGVLDQSGSVWEWTTGTYTAYPKFKPNKYKLKKSGGRKETVEPAPRWNANQRVVMGGAFQFELLAARVTTRRATPRTETTDGLGFRISASTVPGRDIADAVWRNVIRNSGARKGGESFDSSESVGIDRYSTKEIEGNRPEGYAIIDGYEYAVFVPRNELAESPGGELNRASRIAPVLFGYFSTTIPFAEPKLDPGNYLVAYREKGKVITSEEEAEAEASDEGEDGEEAAPAEITDETPLELLSTEQRLLRQIDLNENLIIFMDAETGEYVASMKTKKAQDQKDNKRTSVTGVSAEQKTVWVGATVKEKVQETHDFLTFDAKVRRTAKSRIIPLSLRMRVENGAIGSGWRR